MESFDATLPAETAQWHEELSKLLAEAQSAIATGAQVSTIAQPKDIISAHS